jgi:hypothetical protein
MLIEILNRIRTISHDENLSDQRSSFALIEGEIANPSFFVSVPRPICLRISRFLSIGAIIQDHSGLLVGVPLYSTHSSLKPRKSNRTMMESHRI